MYVQCQDTNGNLNKNYVVDLCVQSGPDATAPRIVATNPMNGAYIRQNISSLSLSVFLNEPAECKYDLFSGKSYDQMSSAMECTTDVNAPALLGWQCTTKLNGLKNTENKFYIRCKDQPWFAGTNETERNTNAEDFVFSLVGTQNQLQIKNIVPLGIVQGSVEPFTVKLEAETSGGVQNGNAICYYSFINYDNTIGFFTTGGAHHSDRKSTRLNSSH